ncbi:hypothetical protein U9M48_022377 [Paspalum notatum var. saurae]|uniref:Pectinesterase inhibitor domain-containing protein n=1 Tax=Paspalum notatum var. saurae TaxID=547442 RepID=A0AAQ3TMW7_PASNO
MAILLLAVVAIAPGLAAAGSSSLINATCAALTTTQPLDFCVGVLSADQAAASATDVREVAAAAINIAASKATSTLRDIGNLTYDLNTCHRQYSNMVQLLADALVDFHAGRFENASHETANATNTPPGCSILLFEGNARKDPIDQENNENESLVDLANGIAPLLFPK